MPSSDWRARIEDILDAIAEIEQFTADMTFDAYSADRRTQCAVLYQFIIIGEAARHVPPDLETRYPDIPWHQMRGMRNIAIHEYTRVNNRIVWETVTDYLPPLKIALREILEHEP